MNLSLINQLGFEEARQAFLRCCGSESWAKALAQARPFASDEELLKVADETFASLKKDDWMEAFAAHPKIGDLESLRKKYGNTKDWAENEQSGVKSTSNGILEGLASGNQAYEQRFGYIFIVCATGKSAEEMLAILNSRIDNEADKEFSIAAGEQKKITHLRLAKL